MRHRKILITGGAGFIGSWLAERLLAQGREVFVIDNLSTGCFDNIEHLTKNANFHYELENVLNERITKIMVDKSDYVCHLAASVGVKTVMDHPLYSLENNIKGTELILQLASQKNKPVLITSTSEVYGKNTKIPFSENDDRIYGSAYNYRWGYAVSKAIDEFLALAYWREKRLPTTVVRLFNTTGPRQSANYGMVLPRFVQLALKNEPIEIHGSGRQTRCFCHVEDIVEALVRIIDNEKTFGEIINLGSQEEVSIANLANKVKVMAGSSSEIKYIPYEQAYGEGFEDMERRVPDITKAKDVLGWIPRYSLDDLIRMVIAFNQR